MVGVIGGSNAREKYIRMASQVGTLLAASGAIVVCGGLGGVMEGVARGARQGGGTTVGILPGNNPAEANSYIDIPIATGIGYARNFLIVRSSDSLIAIDGSNGTISEASFALAEGKTVVSLESMRLKRSREEEGKFMVASTPSDAVRLAIRAATLYRDAMSSIQTHSGV